MKRKIQKSVIQTNIKNILLAVMIYYYDKLKLVCADKFTNPFKTCLGK